MADGAGSDGVFIALYCILYLKITLEIEKSIEYTWKISICPIASKSERRVEPSHGCGEYT